MIENKSINQALSYDWLAQHWPVIAQKFRPIVARSIPQRLQSLISPDDILQETWIAASRQIEQFKCAGDASLHHWLKRILQNKTIDAVRNMRRELRSRREQTEASQGAESTSAGLCGLIPSQEESPSGVFSRSESKARVEQALRRLPEPVRKMIRMRFYEGASEREVAAEMKLTLGTVQGVLRRAQRKLSTLLGPSKSENNRTNGHVQTLHSTYQ